MEKYIPYGKRSKKEKRKLDAARRGDWGSLNPVTRKPQTSKAYDRRKAQSWKKELPNPVLFCCFLRCPSDSFLEEAAIEDTNILKITHETIGNHLGNPREVVTRMLKYFQNEGMVKLSRGTIEIVNQKKLRALTEE